MADFPYIPNIGSLKKFLGQVQTGGVPDKLTIKELQNVGLKSKNDRPIIPILKFLGFVDSSGVPSERWTAYRNKSQARAVMAEAVKGSYGPLFKTYPDANRKDTEALRNYFSSATSVGSGAVAQMVSTFKALCDLGDFGGELPTKPPASKGTPVQPAAKATATAGSRALTVNLKIELQLPATDDAAVYDKLFEAMKKHLLSS